MAEKVLFYRASLQIQFLASLIQRNQYFTTRIINI